MIIDHRDAYNSNYTGIMSSTFSKKIAGFFSGIITPGHAASKFTLGLALGITLVGIVNVLFLWTVQAAFQRNVDITFGSTRIALFVASLLYIAFVAVARRSLIKRVPQVDKSSNSSESLPAIKIDRAA